MNISLLHNVNSYRDDRDPYASPVAEMRPDSYKSTNASFCFIVRILPSPMIFESSGQAFDSNIQEELFLSEAVSDEKKSQVLTSTPVEHLKSTLGINISETADILQITRQAIYDWKSGKAIPSSKNQERINKLIAICKHWENENLGPIRHLIRQNIWNDYSLFDLLCKDELDEKLIYTYFDKIKTYMKALSHEKQQTKNI